MARENFIDAAPQRISEAFAEAGSWGVDGSSFVAAHNLAYQNWLNKVGRTIMDDTDYINPLQMLFQDSMPYGDIVEMLNVEVESWIDAASEDGGSDTRDPLKHYKGKVAVYYSDLAATITAPVTIYDKAAMRALTSLEGASRFYGTHLTAMRRAIDLRRFMLCKELLHRVLTDDTAPSKRKQTIPVTGIESTADALKVWKAINGAMNEMRVSTKEYNIAGISGQVPLSAANGESPFLLIGRSASHTALSTYAADIFHKDSLNQTGLELVLTDNFGGITSSVSAAYNAGDGSQISDMSSAVFTDPHADVQFILCARDSFYATTDWEDVETRRDVGARATTFEPQALHHFFHVPFRPYTALSFTPEVIEP